MKAKRSFLVQIGLAGYRDFENGVYANPFWQRKRADMDHGKLGPGDLLWFYFTGNISNRNQKKQLRFIREVVEVSENKVTVRHKPFADFDPPLSLKEIQESFARGPPGWTFRKCGSQGFNITWIAPTDVEKFFAFFPGRVR